MQSTLLNNDPPQSDDADDWRQIAPLLDDALATLRARDRDALVLRFFEKRTTREIAAALHVEESAAHKRMERALARLRNFFAQRGVTLTAAAIVGATSAHAAQAAPSALAKTISAVAMAKGATAGTSTLTLVKGALKLMAWTKMKTAVVVSVGLLIAIGTTTVAVRRAGEFDRKSEIDSFLADRDLQKFQNAPPLLVIQPTHISQYGRVFYPIKRRVFRSRNGIKIAGRNDFLEDLIATAYGRNLPRIIFPDQTPATNRYDYLVTVPDHPLEQLQAEITRVLGYSGHIEKRMETVQVLKVAKAGAGIARAVTNPREASISRDAKPEYSLPHQPLSTLVQDLEREYRMPIIDQTGLTGKYNVSFDFHRQIEKNGKDRASNLNLLQQALLAQLGLELLPASMSVEMLVVERVK